MAHISKDIYKLMSDINNYADGDFDFYIAKKLEEVYGILSDAKSQWEQLRELFYAVEKEYAYDNEELWELCKTSYEELGSSKQQFEDDWYFLFDLFKNM